MVKRVLHVVGIGMGTIKSLTVEAKKVIEEADLLIGAERMLALPCVIGKKTFVEYRAGEIKKYLAMHQEFVAPCVLVSGDVGFYSGAKNIVTTLSEYDVQLIPGISSIVYFCSKLQMEWSDVDIVSLHGQQANIISHIRRKRKTFAILSGQEELYELADKLIWYGLRDLVLHIGVQLSYEQEKIFHCKPDEVMHNSYGKLIVVLIENENAVDYVEQEIPDEMFIRGKVPMTKSEIRTIAISKLRLRSDSVLFDIGAGTGSVSIQAALNYPESKVIAIERKREAVELINQNKQKFVADNVEIVEGLAPDCLSELPCPTHVFIGGSAGNLYAIIKHIWNRNPLAKIIITTIAVETTAEVINLIREYAIEDAEIVQVGISKAKKAASYHLMTGQNPITIFVLEKTQEKKQEKKHEKEMGGRNGD